MTSEQVKIDIKNFTYHLFEVLMVTFNNEKDVDIEKFVGGYFDFMIKGGLINNFSIENVRDQTWRVGFTKKYTDFDISYDIIFNNEEISEINILSDKFSFFKNNITYGEDGFEKFNVFLGEIKVILDINLR